MRSSGIEWKRANGPAIRCYRRRQKRGFLAVNLAILLRQSRCARNKRSVFQSPRGFLFRTLHVGVRLPPGSSTVHPGVRIATRVCYVMIHGNTAFEFDCSDLRGLSVLCHSNSPDERVKVSMKARHYRPCAAAAVTPVNKRRRASRARRVGSEDADPMRDL
jgi:hypothetical protein